MTPDALTLLDCLRYSSRSPQHLESFEVWVDHALACDPGPPLAPTEVECYRGQRRKCEWFAARLPVVRERVQAALAELMMLGLVEALPPDYDRGAIRYARTAKEVG